MTDHAKIHENLEAYLAGGLTTEERAVLERHADECAECAQALTIGKDLENTMKDLFVDAPPATDLAERTIRRLPQAARVFPIWLRYVAASAAMLTFGVIGAAVQAVATAEHAGIHSYGAVGWRKAGPTESVNNLKAIGKDVNGDPFVTFDIDGSAIEFDAINYSQSRIADVSVPGSGESKESAGRREKQGPGIDMISGLTPNATLTPEMNVPSQNSSFDFAPRIEERMPSGGGNKGADSKHKPSFVGEVFIVPAPKGVDSVTINGRGWYYGLHSQKVVRSQTEVDNREDKSKDKKSFDLSPYALPNQPQNGKPAEYFKQGPSTFTPPVSGPPGVKGSPPPAGGDQEKDKSKDKEDGEKREGEAKKLDEAQKKEEKAENQSVNQPEKPAPIGRKIIRTGEMEFETESFDKAVDTIDKLIDAIPNKGGFVATVNSDKLPNGKMRGSVVVRVRPEFLDKFLKDLRSALAKTSELKSQRIGSADVTKQYTDVESELRAARAVETRLIEIIKTGKGEVKDLVAAERELGTWRTKIEKLEGEKRFYDNQVALSTITILLHEKEIQAASAIVVNEHVSMKIEVEEVKKAQDAVVSAATLAKGRITRSELKLYEAGQLRALVDAEIPPASADTFRELIEKLGVLRHHEAQRTQQAQGGSGRPQDVKPKINDTHFALELYNTANIKPRETFTMKLAVQDVPANYAKLRDEVARLKGRVRKSYLNEHDKLNMVAEFDFDVFTQDRATIDKLIAEAGSIITRNTVQAAVNEIATDRKIGYQLVLRNVAGIAPRETFSYEVTAQDVPASYRKLYDEVIKLQGRILKRNLNEQDKFNVTAQFDFDIAAADKPAFDKFLLENGIVSLRGNDQAVNKEDSTDLKVGYRLTLRSVSGIPPRDIFSVQVASQDVPASYRKLYDEVLRLKGRIHKGQLNEQDKFNVTATFDFDIDAQSKPAIDKAVADAGVTVARNNDQASPKDDATDLKVGYRLVVRNVAGASPREKTTLVLQVSDVDQKAAELKGIVLERKGRVVNAKTKRDAKGQMIAEITYEVPHSSMDVVVQQIKGNETVLRFDKELYPNVPDNELATAHVVVFLSSVAPIIPTDEGVWMQVRNLLYLAFSVFSKGILFIVVGLAFVLPWLVVIWIAFKVIFWTKGPKPMPVVVAAAKGVEKPAGGGA